MALSGTKRDIKLAVPIAAGTRSFIEFHVLLKPDPAEQSVIPMLKYLKEKNVDVNIIRISKILNDMLCAIVHLSGHNYHSDLLIHQFIIQISAEFLTVGFIQGFIMPQILC